MRGVMNFYLYGVVVFRINAIYGSVNRARPQKSHICFGQYSEASEMPYMVRSTQQGLRNAIYGSVNTVRASV